MYHGNMMVFIEVLWSTIYIYTMVYQYGNQSDTMVPPQYFLVRISQYHAQYLISAKTLEYRTLEIIKY